MTSPRFIRELCVSDFCRDSSSGFPHKDIAAYCAVVLPTPVPPNRCTAMLFRPVNAMRGDPKPTPTTY